MGSAGAEGFMGVVEDFMEGVAISPAVALAGAAAGIGVVAIEAAGTAVATGMVAAGTGTGAVLIGMVVLPTGGGTHILTEVMVGNGMVASAPSQ
jgi:hypothetical protein